ncbi:TPA: hypothetical protein ACJKLK_001183 [Acinetobacter baumannii]
MKALTSCLFIICTFATSLCVAGPYSASKIDELAKVNPTEFKASWFADKNSVKAQTKELQAGYDYATSKKVPFVIDGIYYIDGQAQKYDSAQNSKAALILRSNSTLKFDQGAKLITKPNNYSSYTTLVARNVSNVKIVSPVLIGDRPSHKYTGKNTHEWGYGLAIYDGSKNITIADLVIEDMTGDGIYIGREWGSVKDNPPKNIQISNAKISKVRRNGITIASVDGLTIKSPTITDISDKFNTVAPSAAIDIEPEESANTEKSSIKNVVIDSLTAIRVKSPIQTNLTDKRTVDVKFTGVTNLIDSTSSAQIFAYDNTNDTKSISGGITIDNLVVKGNEFAPNLSLKQDNFKFNIKNLSSEKNITVYLIGNTKEISKYNGFSIQNIDSKSKIKAKYNFDYATKKPQKLVSPKYKINYPIEISQ